MTPKKEMFRVKKGQTAMEFLMNYGWAILIVLIAIGSLVYFGVLDSDRFSSPEDFSQIIEISESCDIGSDISKISCMKNAYIYQYNTTVEPDCMDALRYYSTGFQYLSIDFEKVYTNNHAFVIVYTDSFYCLLDMTYMECVTIGGG